MFLLYFCLFLNINYVYSAPISDGDCRDFEELTLTEILGPAYNSRYMSIRQPKERDYQNLNKDGLKRTISSPSPSFYVDDDFTNELNGDEPAWVVKHSEANLNQFNNDYDDNNERVKRSSSKYKRQRNQWQCDSVIKWIDLGPNYFPRYLRTVECVSKLCWYGHYKCKPRSFTVKILKRRRDKCINVDGSINAYGDTQIDKDGQNTRMNKFPRTGSSGMPSELKMLWVWEERAVNFCCDCSL